MLKIRLARVGRKHDPSYRVIVTEKGRGPQTGAYHEKLGTYDARSDEYELKSERIEHWLAEGAQPSDTVHNLLVKAEIIDDDTINPLPKKSPVTPNDEGESEEKQEGGEAPESEDGGRKTDQGDDENDSDTEDKTGDTTGDNDYNDEEESDTEDDTDEAEDEEDPEDDGGSDKNEKEER